ncbi:MAG: winged helix-turn-helix transcriptional regulator [Nitrosopumilaceae archaeon]|nr:winged helix-turn-helix transcriptional regulator [Nitrosopumilaceae archaeon]
MLRQLVEEQEIEKRKDPYLTKLFSEIFTGMQGRYSRLKIILTIADSPLNTRQLSKRLGYDYKSIQRNLEILEKNHLVERIGGGYGDMFFLTDLLYKNLPILLEVIERVDRRLNKKKKRY